LTEQLPPRPPTHLAYCDGASRGNPGPAAIGAVIFEPEGREAYRISRRLGVATNNEAEYRAAIAALEGALGLGARRIELRMDSELVVRQLSGRYRVRNPRLKKYHSRMLALRQQFDEVVFRHVPREENRLADSLANQALDLGP
jgi:ribonuclease HI/probable phosphoglycerate mutase